MSARKKYLYELACDTCLKCLDIYSYNNNGPLYADLPEGWTKHIEETGKFRGVTLTKTYHYCKECSSQQQGALIEHID